jgi:hypothetical protein
LKKEKKKKKKKIWAGYNDKVDLRTR